MLMTAKLWMAIGLLLAPAALAAQTIRLERLREAADYSADRKSLDPAIKVELKALLLLFFFLFCRIQRIGAQLSEGDIVITCYLVKLTESLTDLRSYRTAL